VKKDAIILSILRMMSAEIALAKKVNWMTIRLLSTSKIIISNTPKVPCERKFIDAGQGKMINHAILTTK
jgi:hypothetical protein